MELAFIDWAIIIGFLVISLVIGLYYKKAAGNSLTDFFLGGRNLPWYIAGISMVATTFAADTPLAVSELVSSKGIAANWLWWSFLAGGMLTAFFFSQLWRRADILTEVEFINIRYGGKKAKFLRSFKAVYLGLFMNCMIIGWVNLAFNSILITFFGISEDTVLYYTLGAMTIALIYTSLSGLKGVAITDALQFVIAMIGCIILAVIVVNSEQIGGISGLKEKLPEQYFNFFPSLENDTENSFGNTLTLSVGAFFSFIAVQWWASWYPGAEPGGGGYVAQRMMSCKDEKNSLWATIFFQIAHYCVRPWPWIVVGLCAIALYALPYQDISPELSEQIIQMKADGKSYQDVLDTESVKSITNPSTLKSIEYTFNERLGFIYAMKDFLPTGLKGLLLVAFLAAYLSTISTQLNWGASYLVNDFYLPLSKADSKNHVSIGRIFTVGIMLVSLISTSFITSISGVWEFIMECGAGLGLVLILRWYWWRINAWSEIVATLAPFVGYTIGHFLLEPYFGDSFIENKGGFLFTVLFTTTCWIVATYTTKPENDSILIPFYKKIKPQGAWKAIKDKAEKDIIISNDFKFRVLAWISSIVFTYGLLFTLGKVVFQLWDNILIYLISLIISFIILKLSINKLKLN